VRTACVVRAGSARSFLVELPIDRADVQAIMVGLLDANWKLDKILRYLEGEDDEEEDEADSP
jgi:hypothetical protein